MTARVGRVFHRCGCRPDGEARPWVCLRREEIGHGSWYFSAELLPDPDGSRKRLRVGGYDSQAAAQRGWEQATSAPAGRPAAGWTVGAWLTYWLAAKQELRWETCRNYESHLRLYLLPALGSVPLVTLGPVQIRVMLAQMVAEHVRRGRGSVPTSVVRVHATLRAALNAARREGLITANPAWLVELPRVRKPHPVVWTAPRVQAWQETGQRPPVAVWTAAQTATLLASVRGDPLHPLLHLIALRGLRRGEAIGLRWTEVDLPGAALTVCRQLQEGDGQLRVSPPKSAASNRELPLDAGTVTLLREHHRAQLDRAASRGAERGGGPASGAASGWVFAKPDGRPYSPSWVSHRFALLVRRSGLPPVRLHDLRHGAATLALAAGADLKTIQDMLGHASIVLTADIYTSVLPDVARQAAEGIAHLIIDAGRTKPGSRAQ